MWTTVEQVCDATHVTVLRHLEATRLEEHVQTALPGEGGWRRKAKAVTRHRARCRRALVLRSVASSREALPSGIVGAKLRGFECRTAHLAMR